MHWTFEVWSSGLEVWETAILGKVEKEALVFVHEKPVNNVVYEFYRDPLNRWFRIVKWGSW